jgi:hypothetical protein
MSERGKYWCTKCNKWHPKHRDGTKINFAKSHLLYQDVFKKDPSFVKDYKQGDKKA